MTSSQQGLKMAARTEKVWGKQVTSGEREVGRRGAVEREREREEIGRRRGER